MPITIEEINRTNVHDIDTCNGEFTIDAKLVLHVENGTIGYTVVDAPGTTKRYAQDHINYAATIGNPDKTVFLAYADGQFAGQITLGKSWNGYACIESIAVDLRFRRHGIGKALISQATQWARKRNLAGVMLETQNNNVNACKFYERCGFQLAGFDTRLYKGIDPETDEIALYWYLLFDSARPINATSSCTETPLPQPGEQADMGTL